MSAPRRIRRLVRQRQEDWLRRSGMPLVLAPRVRSLSILAERC